MYNSAHKTAYPVTMGDLMCPGGGPVCELSVKVRERVDPADLEEAMEMAAGRYPYLASEAVFDHGRMVLRENRKPFIVLEGNSFMPGCEEMNGHLWNVSCENDRIIFRFQHSIMDGHGSFVAIKTVIHCYLKIHYGEALCCQGLWLPDECPDREEYADPFSFVRPPERSIRTVHVPEYFTIPEEDTDLERDAENHIIHIPKDPFLRLLSSQDCSPAPFLSLMLCRAIDEVYPAHDKPIVIASPADIRNILGCRKTLQYCLSLLWFIYDDRVKNMPLDIQATCFRGMLMRQMDPDYIMQETWKMKNRYERNVMLRDSGETIDTPWISMPYMLTYVGNVGLGDMEKYCQPIEIHDAAPAALLSSVSEANGIFRMSLELRTKTSDICHALLRQFDAAGVPYSEMGSDPL